MNPSNLTGSGPNPRQPESTGAAPEVSRLHRREADRQIAEWRRIDVADLTRRTRELRLLGSFADRMLASVIYRGGTLRESLRRVAVAADRGLGEPEQNELMAVIDANDPARLDFNMSVLRRLVAHLPGIGTPFDRWRRACRASVEDVDQLGARMVSAREPFKHAVARLARVLNEARELALRLQDRLAYGRHLLDRLRGLAEAADTDTAWPAEIVQVLSLRLDELERVLDEHNGLCTAADAVVRDARGLIGGQRQVVSAVRDALLLADPSDGARDPKRHAELAAAFDQARQQLRSLSELLRQAVADIQATGLGQDRRHGSRSDGSAAATGKRGKSGGA